jgi:alpha-tubulin suppressor-like RCC1 family protein
MSSNIYTNVLFIDKEVIDFNVICESVNSQTLPIIYSDTTSRSYILSLLQDTFETIDRIGFCFVTKDYSTNNFLDSEPFFITEESTAYSSNVEFIINIIQEFKVKNIDYLGCNTLSYENWNNYYDILKKETSVIVGASNNRTGNLLYGGDWLLESTCEDVENIYFTKQIEYYQYLFDSSSSTHTVIINNVGDIYGCGLSQFGGLSLYTPKAETSSFIKLDTTAFNNVKPVRLFTTLRGTFALLENGHLYATGEGNNGELFGFGGSKFKRVTFTSLDNFLSSGVTIMNIASGFTHTLMLLSNGTIYVGGSNRGVGYSPSGPIIGQLGDGTNTGVNPHGIMPNSTGLIPIGIAAGHYFSVVLMNNGAIYGTGDNSAGQLGIDNVTYPKVTSLTLMPLPTLPIGVVPVKISCSKDSTFVLMSNNTIYSTGNNSGGQLGIGNKVNKNSLTLVDLSQLSTGEYVTDISSAILHVVIITNLCNLYGAGYNAPGSLGTGDYIDRTIFTPFAFEVTPFSGNPYPKAISANSQFTLVMMFDGTIYGCGDNFYGMLSRGNDSTMGTVFYPKILAPLLIYSATTTTYIPMTGVTKIQNCSHYQLTKCFNEDTKILCLNGNLEEEYIPIQNLKKGDLVKTYLHGYRKIEIIGKNTLKNNLDNYNECMYKMKKTDDNGLIEDLILTGGHSILVDDLGEYKRDDIDEVLYLKVDDKYLLLCSISSDFSMIEDNNMYTYYNFVLENNGNDDERFGVWASGILVESTSKNEFYTFKYNTD